MIVMVMRSVTPIDSLPTLERSPAPTVVVVVVVMLVEVELTPVDWVAGAFVVTLRLPLAAGTRAA